MLCKNMILVGVDKDVVSRMIGQPVPDNVECAVTICALDMECSEHYCEGPTDDGICAHYEQGSGMMVRADGE